MNLEPIVKILKSSGSVAVLPHVDADGDALGSCLALALALKGMGKRVKVLLEEEIPFIYSFLPGKELTEIYTAGGDSYDLAVALDTGDLGRLGTRSSVFERTGITVNIDHHSTNSEFAFHNYIQASAAAVGEIVYGIIGMLGLKTDRDMAICLYTAIATDTGGFRFSNTTAITHRISAELIDCGVPVAEVSQRVFDSISYGKVKLMGLAIDSLKLFENGKIAIVSITPEMMKEAGAVEEDCEGIVNLGRSIRGVEVAVMLRQWETNEVKANLRSNTNFDVASLAALYKGGGHKKAAGCIIKGSIEEVKSRLLKDMTEQLKHTL